MKTKKIVFLTLITTIIVISFSLSRYESALAGNDKTKVAIPIISLLTDNVIEVDINPISPNNEQKFYFKIINYKDQEETKVKMKYTIEIKSLNNLPLEFELYNSYTNEQIKLNSNLTEFIEMPINSTEHNYLLNIKWNDKYNDYKFSKITDYVQIYIYSEQID